MADNKKMVEAITSMDEDFAQWYTDVVKKAELCDYASVKGCMVIKPAGYAIWENIQKEMDRRFKETGVQNVYMPIFIPESLLEKEKDHVEGFAPEVAWVTHGGLEELQERMCVRPTSETLFCDFYAKDIHSYRDLPRGKQKEHGEIVQNGDYVHFSESLSWHKNIDCTEAAKNGWKCTSGKIPQQCSGGIICPERNTGQAEKGTGGRRLYGL